MHFEPRPALTVHRPPITSETVCAAGGCTAHAAGTGPPIEHALAPPGHQFGVINGLRPYCADHGRHSDGFSPSAAHRPDFPYPPPSSNSGG